MKMTKEENAEIEAIVNEAAEKAIQATALFERTPRGMMVYLAAMELLKGAYPAISEMAERHVGTQMIVQWIAAGRPDSLTEVPARLLARFGPEVFHQIEESYAKAYEPDITPEVCDQCNGTGQLKGGARCGCKEEDDEARERRNQMGVVK